MKIPLPAMCCVLALGAASAAIAQTALTGSAQAYLPGNRAAGIPGRTTLRTQKLPEGRKG